jgi:hypothetical protein
MGIGLACLAWWYARIARVILLVHTYHTVNAESKAVTD